MIVTPSAEDLGFEATGGWLRSLYPLLLPHNAAWKITDVLNLGMPASSQSCKSLIKRKAIVRGTYTHRPEIS